MTNWLHMLKDNPLPWLLEEETPAVRHLALRQLLDEAEDAPEVRQARAAAMRTDPIASILAAEQPEGFWVKPGPGYAPKYRGTVWQLIFLDQLGADGRDARVQAACEYVLSHSQADLHTEGIQTCTLGGQSYGGLLAQAYLAHRPGAVDQLILSSAGPANYGKSWLPIEYAAIALARLLPEKAVKNMLIGRLVKVISLPEAERAGWLEAINTVMQHELSRADVISHFAVAADIIRRDLVTPAAYHNWPGRVIVLSAQNDPTQSNKDLPRYEQLFGRAVQVVNMGNMGHAAALFSPDTYVALLEQALVLPSLRSVPAREAKL